MIYNKIIERCFFKPEHVGSIDLDVPLSVYHSLGGENIADRVDLYLLAEETGLLIQARFKAYGNPYLVAGAELVCQQLEGSCIKEHPAIDYRYLIRELSIPEMRYAAALQIEDVYRATIIKMKEKLTRKQHG